MAGHWSRATVAKFIPISPEIAALPPGWTNEHCMEWPHEIFYNGPFEKRGYDHPTLGPLPEGWRFVLYNNNDSWEPRYWNEVTNEYTTANPRLSAEYLQSRKILTASSPEMSAATGLVKNAPGLMAKLRRAEIGKDRSLRDHYDIVHVIDPGDGSIGAMNGGVFVVKYKGQPTLYVEKRFKDSPETRWDLIKRELEILQKIRHGALTMFCAGFINDKVSPKEGSVYVEFCDRGSLDDLILKYAAQRYAGNKVTIPEKFIWHAFLGLADAYAYLMGGRSYVQDKPGTVPHREPGWVPILHRDTKPDNILLRSRMTLGSNKYFYCILTDFGLSCYDDGNDIQQKQRTFVGTPHWIAPELLHDPYPKLNQTGYFPGPARYTARSDVWSLAACIFDCASPDPSRFYLDEDHKSVAYPGVCAHLDFSKKPKALDANSWAMGRGSKHKMSIPAPYSKQLREGVMLAGNLDVNKRPEPIELVYKLKELMEQAGVKGTGIENESDKLPVWATRHHDYHIPKNEAQLAHEAEVKRQKELQRAAQAAARAEEKKKKKEKS